MNKTQGLCPRQTINEEEFCVKSDLKALSTVRHVDDVQMIALPSLTHLIFPRNSTLVVLITQSCKGTQLQRKRIGFINSPVLQQRAPLMCLRKFVL
ncbi:PREDICTED: uncharacterized protein LOC107345619 isoform X2 [Acropora digitifera]|uniref:uncharacterized protein LOC107345619 isoform X2 n=1 Tax=Acropora digitifera TaxID=70779 RepID=UPI00077A957B|nr:PREDICTED: uncharacterized protein LOC107345619 isoform X2 [Acropora digitifera]